MSEKAATIYDYLDWRGDLLFSMAPFNEVDNVILSLLAYVDYEGVLSGSERLSLGEAATRYFSLHTREELLARESFVKMTPFLMEKAGATERFSGILLHDYVNILDASAEEQFSAVAFDLGDGTTYIGFRGTDDTLIGWKEDFNIAYLSRTRGQQHAAAYLSETGSRSDRPLRIGGHSKGGNLAMYASAYCEEGVRKRITEIYNNDGPGFLREVAVSQEIKAIRSRIRCLIPNESVFGLLMYGDYDRDVIKSTIQGILQHDALSWQVLGSSFVRADGLAESSLVVEKILREWVEGVDLEQRRQFVQFVFDAIRTSGANTLEELSLGKLRNFSTIIQAAFSMERDRRDAFMKVLSVLLKSGTETLTDEIKKTFSELGRQAEGLLPVSDQKTGKEKKEEAEG